MTTMNLITIAMFFNKTYTKIFIHPLIVESINDGLYSPISTYFGIVKINGRGILHFNYLV